MLYDRAGEEKRTFETKEKKKEKKKIVVATFTLKMKKARET